MQVSDFAVGGGWWVQDHGWLAGWLAGWLDAPARAHARMHPSSQPRARMHNKGRFSMHSDQIMHCCMHAFASPFPIGAGFTRFTDTVFCDASVYLLMRFFGGQLVSDGEFIVLLCRFNATALLYILYR